MQCQRNDHYRVTEWNEILNLSTKSYCIMHSQFFSGPFVNPYCTKNFYLNYFKVIKAPCILNIFYWSRMRVIRLQFAFWKTSHISSNLTWNLVVFCFSWKQNNDHGFYYCIELFWNYFLFLFWKCIILPPTAATYELLSFALTILCWNAGGRIFTTVMNSPS